MAEEQDDSIHVTVPRGVAATLLLAVGLGGAGAGVTLGPQIEKSALEQCYDNSSIALQVSAQHGEEIKNLETFIIERTRSRWTEEDHNKWSRDHDREHRILERRIEFLENQK